MLQYGPLALSHAPQIGASFGAGKQPNLPSPVKSHVSPVVELHPSFVTGLHSAFPPITTHAPLLGDMEGAVQSAVPTG